MAFFKNLFKRDSQIDEEHRKRTMEIQAELWEKQLANGQTVNVQKDMEKIYGLDKIQQKNNERAQAKEIVKGAVVGSIVAGDAGAVVGATIAKNNIDSRKAEAQSHSSYNAHTYTAPVSSSANGPQQNYYDIEVVRSKLTGNLQDDVVYIVSQLGNALVSHIAEILDMEDDTSKVSRYLRMARQAGKIEMFEFERKAWFRISPTAQKTDPISSADEIKKFKELLDTGVITQEEFDAKKKQLLGL